MSDQSCACCGRALRVGETVLTWMRDTDAEGRSTWTCTECARKNVRAVEAKLDSQWW